MNIKIYPRALFGYCGIIILFRLISIYTDANLGMVLFVIFCIFFCISPILCFLSSLCISIYADKADIKTVKNQLFTYRVKIVSKLPVALAFVEVKLREQKYLESKNGKINIGMVDAFSPMTVWNEYKASVYGTDEVGVEYVRIRDFLGILSVKKNVEKVSIKVRTLPEYVENVYNRDVIFFLGYMADFDDSEEVNGGLSTTSGFPGYEHREYVVGDSPKRVNYKLSAKKDKLMVRLDEPSTLMKTAVILNDISSEDRYRDEMTIEAMMSYTGCLVKNKITVDVYFNMDGKQIKMTVTDDRDFTQLISSVMEFAFCKKDESIMGNVHLSSKNSLSSVVIFSTTGYVTRYAESIDIPYRIITPNREKKGTGVLYIDKNLNIGMGGVSYEEDKRAVRR